MSSESYVKLSFKFVGVEDYVLLKLSRPNKGITLHAVINIHFFPQVNVETNIAK